MQTAIAKWNGGEEFLATMPSGHTVAFDSDREHNAAPGPMEMLLAALAACTATDVVIILGKKRQKLEGLEVDVSGERAADPPRVWTSLEIVYRLRGALDDAAAQRAIELSENKYCSVLATLRKSAAVSFRYEILR